MLISYIMFAMPRKSVWFGGLSSSVVLYVIHHLLKCYCLFGASDWSDTGPTLIEVQVLLGTVHLL
jgi:hypothetical protein